MYICGFQLCSVTQELNKRIYEHDNAANLGFDRPEVTLAVSVLQCIHLYIHVCVYVPLSLSLSLSVCAVCAYIYVCLYMCV